METIKDLEYFSETSKKIGNEFYLILNNIMKATQADESCIPSDEEYGILNDLKDAFEKNSQERNEWIQANLSGEKRERALELTALIDEKSKVAFNILG